MPCAFLHYKWLIAIAAALSLAACGSNDAGIAPPPSDESLAAVSEEPGANPTALAHTIDALFNNETMGETRALLVMQGGQISAERYGEGFGPDTPQLGWSLSKTVIGLMIGMMVSDGSLALDAPAPIPRWRRPGDPRGAITLRHLLQMRSGLRHNETAGPAQESDTIRMLFRNGRDDMAHYAQTQPLDHDAGTRFAYSTAETQILTDIATRSLTESREPAARRAAMQGWLESRLFEPLAMESMVAEYDASGTLIGGAMIHASARDWAKIGELIRLRGVAGGAQIVPRGWIAFMRGSNPADEAFGAHLWRNRQRDQGRDPVLFDGRGPADAVAALGHGGQFIISVPSKGLTVVRLGHSSAAQQGALNDRMLDLVELFPDQ